MSERQIFTFANRRFDIDEAQRLVAANPDRELTDVRVAQLAGLLGLIRVDDERARQVDLDRPLILSPLGDGSEGVIPIDGWHRIRRAQLEDVEFLFAHVLTEEESRQVQLEFTAERGIDSFTVGEQVWLRADQGWRRGLVTAIGRSRLTIRHPRNQQGDLKEKAYSLNSIVLKQERQGKGWRITRADGETAWSPDAIPDMAITLNHNSAGTETP